MRIGFISDLHYDVNSHLLKEIDVGMTVGKLVKITKEVIKEEGLDYLFISGDIANSIKTIEIVRELNTTGVRVRYVPGNHDVWSVDRNTERQYSKFIKDENCLVNKYEGLGKYVGVVGLFSWYDSTLSTISEETEFFQERKGLWGDSIYTDWFGKREEIVQKHIAEVEKKVKEYWFTEIILLNHFLPKKDFIVHKEGNDDWNFANSFMGTEKVLELVERNKNIQVVTFGHTHIRYGEKIEDDVLYISGPLGYVHEWGGHGFRGRLKECLVIKEF